MTQISEIIADVTKDIRRTDLTADVSAEVCSALRYYSPKPWWFAETSYDFTTTASTEAYMLPADWRGENYMEIQRSNGEFYELYHMHLNDLRRKNEGINTNGYPENYTIYDKQVYLGYIPNQAYVVRMWYDKGIGDELSATYSSDFTTELRELVRYRAGHKVASVRMHDTELANTLKAQEMDEWDQLRSEHTQRVGSNRVRAWR